MTPGLHEFLPHFNALMNTLSATLIISGYAAIKMKNRILHKILMCSAFASSSLFLAGYLLRHAISGTTYFQGTGIVKIVYLTILISHMILAICIVPGILRMFFLAYKERFDEHRKLAKFVFPSWLYVSITGVAVYFMLYRMY